MSLLSIHLLFYLHTLEYDRQVNNFNFIYNKVQCETFSLAIVTTTSWLNLSLKLVSAIFYQVFIFHQTIALQKIWKMFFIASKKLFSFSRYLIFYISIFPYISTCQPLL